MRAEWKWSKWKWLEDPLNIESEILSDTFRPTPRLMRGGFGLIYFSGTPCVKGCSWIFLSKWPILYKISRFKQQQIFVLKTTIGLCNRGPKPNMPVWWRNLNEHKTLKLQEVWGRKHLQCIKTIQFSHELPPTEVTVTGWLIFLGDPPLKLIFGRFGEG